MIKVMLVDDVQGRMPSVLCDRESDAYLVAEATNERDAIYFASGCDIALVNMQARRLDVQSIVRGIAHRHPEVKVLMIGAPDPDVHLNGLMDLIASGASGYITTRDSEADLLEKIRAANEDRAVVSSRFAMQLMKYLASLHSYTSPRYPVDAERAQRLRKLTRRQREVLALVAEGASNAEIGMKLNITEGTVKNHVSRILRILDVDSREYASAIYCWSRKRESNGNGRHL